MASLPAPIPRPGLLELPRYIPGSARAPAGRTLHKLSSNESALGPSPAARAAFLEAAARLHRYPDGSARLLAEAIATTHDLDPRCIVCGAGSEQLIQLLARGYLGPGDVAVQSQHGFLLYRIATGRCGATPRFAPERALRADVDALLAAIDADTRVVFLANPNNPTGTWLPPGEVARLHAGLPPQVLLVLDGAYAELLDAPDDRADLRLALAHPNVVVTRTFSKLYGLAGLRLGWAYGPPAVIEILHRLRGPFNLSGPAIEAGIAAVRDQAFLAESRAQHRAWRAELAAGLAALGVPTVESAGNFLLAGFSDPGALQAGLREAGVLVREVTPYGLEGWLRISVGSPAAQAALFQALPPLLERAR